MSKKFVMLLFIVCLLSLLTSIFVTFFLRVQRNISYSDVVHPRQTMDLYTSRESLQKKTLVVFVYGGAWRTGSKNYYTHMGKFFSNLGYPTLIPDYRLYPEVQFPAFVDDVAMAIKQAEQIDGLVYDDIILAGHSAGGHTAALLAADSSYFTQYGIQKPIRAFIGLSAPYDLPFDEELTPIFETAINNQEKTNAVALVSESMPPSLLLHGSDDIRVGLHHTENFSAKLKLLGVPTETVFIENYSHAQIVINFLPVIHGFSKPAQLTRNFLDRL